MIEKNKNKPDKGAEMIKQNAAGERPEDKCVVNSDPKAIEFVSDDEEYWEEMLFLSRGPRKWNIGCGCS